MTAASALIPATLTGAFAFGTGPALLMGLRPVLAKRLGVEERSVGRLSAALSLLLAPLLLVAGLLGDHWGSQEVLICGALAQSVGLCALAAGRTFRRAAAAVVPLAVGGAGLGVASIVLMPRAFFPTNPAAATLLGTLFFTLGALLAPALANRLVAWTDVRRSLLVLALLSLVPGLAAAVTPWPPAPAGPAAAAYALDAPVLWVAALVLFFYVPLEVALAAWSSKYLIELGHRPGLASTLMTGFWLSFLACRAAAGLLWGDSELILADPEPWIILLLALAAAITLGNLAGAERSHNASLGLFLVGAFLGPVLPLLLGFVLRVFAPEVRGIACGAVLALGTVGGLLVPLAAGGYARRADGRDVLRIPLALALLVAGSALILALLQSR